MQTDILEKSCPQTWFALPITMAINISILNPGLQLFPDFPKTCQSVCDRQYNQFISQVHRSGNRLYKNFWVFQ
jgi:hypothetical protein